MAPTTTTVDPLAEFRDEARSSAQRIDRLRHEAVLINEEWDARTVDYPTTHGLLEDLVGEVEGFSAMAGSLSVPSAVGLRWDWDETVQGLTEASREMLVGLEMSDDGSHRIEALETFASLVDKYVEATGVVIPPSTTTTVGLLRRRSQSVACFQPR